MDPSQEEVLDIFTRTRALLTGHFVLRSGLHSAHYFQCAQVCQHMDAVERLSGLLLAKVRASGWDFSTVLAPAMGGLVIGQEVARQAKARYIFCEKENNVLVLRRGFRFAPQERVLVVEDVVTRGGPRARVPRHCPEGRRGGRRRGHARRPERRIRPL
jgi:orotate phosphoribosyltransferase